jgi:translation initiation factor 2 beta subunit (eIF-2beta)/eIF-5
MDDEYVICPTCGEPMDEIWSDDFETVYSCECGERFSKEKRDDDDCYSEDDEE